ncbi:aminopeptidase P family protein [Bacillus ginsengihumi]|uniref:Aminopeptidase P family protein n=1 Tax=Heyndrickxia ginsengihumi TaxID=363870 RepID=A0A6M0P6A1_9BACI|nr:Xaa-Pro peptidase family protein [Heyndrickxia ginsengihumi]NEY19519.1 aminopeptidase P family protein [Heyndrickxia ginsengihumi]
MRIASPIFTAEEICRRQSAVINKLNEEDCFIALSFHNSYYLSGLPMLQWGRFAATILFKDGRHVLIIPEFETGAAAIESPITEIHTYRDSDGPTHTKVVQLIAKTLKEREVKIAGVEAEGIPASFQTLLTKQMPNVVFVDRTDAVNLTRFISSDEEFCYIQEACRLTDIGMHKVVEMIKKGSTEIEVSRAACNAMKDAAKTSYPLNVSCYLQQGQRSDQCHALPDDLFINPGNMVEVVIEAEVAYYQASLERPILVGDVSTEIHQACLIAIEAFNAGFSVAKPGGQFANIDKAARAVFHANGFDQIPNGSGLMRGIVHHTGGRSELGEVRHYNTRILEPGMVLTIEPWAIIPEVGSPRECDTILITQNGAEIINTFPRGITQVANSNAL